VPAALGFSDHSGWAVLAAVEGAAGGDYRLLFRRRIETCPPRLPRQAYHAVAEAGGPRSTVAEVRAAALERCSEAIAAAVAEAPSLSVAAIAVGRTAIPGNLDRILASHALLHAAEGELYREALSEAAAAHGFRVVRFMNREVRSEAAATLGWPLERLEDWLADTGKQAGRPWTRDEKDAASAALLALATVQ
jgi:hypothetical protein